MWSRDACKVTLGARLLHFGKFCNILAITEREIGLGNFLTE